MTRSTTFIEYNPNNNTVYINPLQNEYDAVREKLEALGYKMQWYDKKCFEIEYSKFNPDVLGFLSNKFFGHSLLQKRGEGGRKNERGEKGDSNIQAARV